MAMMGSRRSHIITVRFFSEIQNTLQMGKAMGYNLEGYFDRVKEIVEGNRYRVVIK